MKIKIDNVSYDLEDEGEIILAIQEFIFDKENSELLMSLRTGLKKKLDKIPQKGLEIFNRYVEENGTENSSEDFVAYKLVNEEE